MMQQISFNIKPVLIALISLVFSTVIFAAPIDNQAIRLKNKLQKEMGQQAEIKSVEKSVLPNLYQVVVGNDVFYIDETGRYIFSGNLLDTEKHENLTMTVKNEISKINFAELPFEHAIVTKRGTGKRKLAVFSDPNCPYCQQYEHELKKLNNVSIYTFIYPILGEKSEKLAKQIWCSGDRHQSWDDWMLSKKEQSKTKATKKEPALLKESCGDEMWKNNLAFGKKHDIQGTPATILPSGKRISGIIDINHLNATLEEENKIKNK